MFRYFHPIKPPYSAQSSYLLLLIFIAVLDLGEKIWIGPPKHGSRSRMCSPIIKMFPFSNLDPVPLELKGTTKREDKF